MVVVARWFVPLALLGVLPGCSDNTGGRTGNRVVDGAGGESSALSSGGAFGTGGKAVGAGGAAPSAAGGTPSDAGSVPDGSDGSAGATNPRLPPDRCADPTESATADELRAAVDDALALSRATLAERYPTAPGGSLGYSPGASAGLDLIQGSGHALTSGELAQLESNGFLLSDRQRFPTFFYGYRSLYAADLPLYVTVDSILHAVHKSYDDILATLERSILLPDLRLLLEGLRSNLSEATTLPAETRADVDLYLGVAKSLLEGTDAVAVAGASNAEIANLATLCRNASGLATIDIFGTQREEDFSQFVPRGHYEGQSLSNYFRATMWLGRIDLRLLETLPDGRQELRRRQVAAALAMSELLTTDVVPHFDSIDRVVRTFVGEVDSMTPRQGSGLLAALGIRSVASLDTKEDGAISSAILATPYGMQRIASHVMRMGPAAGTLPLGRSFTLLGQRYTLDSHVFSNVVYDRVEGGVRRMMPNPLDAAFAALGNNQALSLLAPDLAAYDYAGELGAMRELVDQHRCGYFESNLYNLWLASLRALSPTEDTAGLPSVARTEAWGRRILSTQLASWAELRHDTLLYAKQSYTGVPLCEFPDAYVDPYPRAFDRIAALALRGRELSDALPVTAPGAGDVRARVTTYFTHLYEVALLLKEVAEHELAGTPLTAEHLAFINNAVVYKQVSVTCAMIEVPGGWYPELFFDPEQSDKYDPTIADVHTQPADEAGSIVGRVLHVGTGMPRLFVATIDTCTGPRAYAGVASAYFERVTENFERMTDSRWAAELEQATPADPAWVADLVAR